MKVVHALEKNVAYYDNGFWDYIRNYTEYYEGDFPEIPERLVATQIEQVMAPLLVCLGLPLHLLTIKVLFRLADRYLPTCGFLAVTSIMDVLLLVIISGNAWMTTWVQRDIINELTAMTSGLCKFAVFLLHTFHQLANWSVVFFVYTTRCHLTGGCFMIGWTSSHVTDLMVVGLVALMCLNAQYFWTYDIIQYGMDAWDIPQDDADPNKAHPLTGLRHCVFDARGLEKREEHADYYYVSVMLDSVITDLLPSLALVIYLSVLGWHHYKPTTECEEEDTATEQSYYVCTELIQGLTDRTPMALCVIQLLSCLPLFIHVLCETTSGLYHRSAATNPHQDEVIRARWYLSHVLLLQFKMVCTVLRFPIYCYTSPQFLTIVRHMGVWWKNLCLGRRDSLHTTV